MINLDVISYQFRVCFFFVKFRHHAQKEYKPVHNDARNTDVVVSFMSTLSGQRVLVECTDDTSDEGIQKPTSHLQALLWAGIDALFFRAIFRLALKRRKLIN